MTPPMPPSSGPSEPREYGYQVPPPFGMPAPDAGDLELDPLVPPPGSRFSPWFKRLVATLGRSWRTLGVTILLTFALPQLAQSLLGLGASVTFGAGTVEVSGGGELQFDATALVASVLPILLLQVVVLFVNAVGWGAGIWAVTQEAAGQPATVGDALRAGLRRSVPMFGWYLLFWLMVLAGLGACVLPGVYLFVYGSLFSFAVVYERGRGIGRSFGLVHRQSRTAGRVLLLALIYLVVVVLVGLVTGLAALGLGGGGSAAASAGLQLAGALVQAAVLVPLIMMMLVGLLLTYTQLRAGEEQITTGQLWATAYQP